VGKTILQGRKYDKWPGAQMNIATALPVTPLSKSL